MRRLWTGVLLAAATACGDRAAGTSADAGGTLVIATPADADVLFPPLTMSSTGRAVVDNVFERLAEAPAGDTVATVGDAGWRPRVASRWTWATDSLSIAFAIDPRARFHDGVPVRARDVAFTFRLLRDPALGSPLGTALQGVDSVTVRDSLTAVAWFHRRTAEQFYGLAYQLFVLPAHQLDSIPAERLRSHPVTRAPVGSGRFRFGEWRPGERIVLVADSTHPRGRPGVDRVVWTLVPDPSAALGRVIAGEADVFERLTGPQFGEARAAAGVVVTQHRTRQVGSLIFHVGAPGAPHPVLGDGRVRRAIAHALDLRTIARAVFDTLGEAAAGPLPGTVGTGFPYDTARSAALLDSAGWRRGPDGMRRRGATALAFAILVPAPSRPRVQLATLAQEALRRVGVAVRIEQQDFPAFVARLGARRFDAALQVVSLDPSPLGLREQWSAAAVATGGNLSEWRSAAFDAALDSAEAAATPAASGRHLRVAIDTLMAQAPAVFMVQPRGAMALRDRVRPAALRDDGWWSDLADWTIAPSGRLPRDRAAP